MANFRDALGFLINTLGQRLGLTEIKGENAAGTNVNGLKVNDDGSINTATYLSGITSTAITTIATTVVKSTPGVIGTISNGSNAVTGIITVYDNTTATGKLIWAGTLAAGQVLPIGIPCTIGITVVTAGAQAIVVSYA